MGKFLNIQLPILTETETETERAREREREERLQDSISYSHYRCYSLRGLVFQQITDFLIALIFHDKPHNKLVIAEKVSLK
jgi:hypothetical protein